MGWISTRAADGPDMQHITIALCCYGFLVAEQEGAFPPWGAQRRTGPAARPIQSPQADPLLGASPAARPSIDPDQALSDRPGRPPLVASSTPYGVMVSHPHVSHIQKKFATRAVWAIQIDFRLMRSPAQDRIVVGNDSRTLPHLFYYFSFKSGQGAAGEIKTEHVSLP